MSLIGLDKWAFLMKMIAHNGGPFKSLYKLWRFDTLKYGELVGVDKFGNKYYENPYYMIARSRWVEYSDKAKWNYDASQVTPEWFGWLHYKTDCLPSEDCAKHCLTCCSCYHRWLLPYSENMSGTERAYYPYSTVRPSIQPWDGTSVCNR